MKIYVLVDNTASAFFQAEHGLSFLIEHDEHILFDTGHSDLFLHNAKRLNLDLSNVHSVVLSHGHWDHGNGLKYLSKKKLICHPDAFQHRFRKGSEENIGLDTPFKELKNKFEIVYTRSPYLVAENVIFLGEIPRQNHFEAKTTAFELENGTPDFVMDDSAIVIIHDGELIVLSGCAHAGICNIIEYAKAITGIVKIRAVMGGFHLKHKNEQTQETIRYLKEQDIKAVYPSHCTELPALSAFYESFGIQHVKAGMALQF